MLCASNKVLVDLNAALQEQIASLAAPNIDASKQKLELERLTLDNKELKEKLARVEDELERLRSRQEGRHRDQDAEKSRYEEEVASPTYHNRNPFLPLKTNSHDIVSHR